jgi:hypothetical protein
MKRWFVSLAALVLVSATLQADVTVKSATSIEGGPPGAAGAGGTITLRVKGLKSRTETAAAGISVVMIADVENRRIIMLVPESKTAEIYDSSKPIAGAAAMADVNVDATVKPTGKSNTVDERPCEDYAILMALGLGEALGGRQLPPEAAEMLKGVTVGITGTMCVAKSGPGVAELAAFSRAAVDAKMAAALTGTIPGQTSPALERLASLSAQVAGLPLITEMNMAVAGTGPLADMMKQFGAMKLISKVTSVSTDPIADDLFTIPADYTTVK